MKLRIFTLFPVLFLIGNLLKAQPLPDSPLPDTITYKEALGFDNENMPINQKRLLLTYNDQRLKEKVSVEVWDQTTSQFNFQADSTFSYHADGRISQIKIGNYVTFSYFYNQHNKDSLRVLKQSDGTIISEIKYFYDAMGNLESKQNKKRYGTSLVNESLEFYQYNALQQITLYHIDSYKDGALLVRDEYLYEYNADNRLWFDSRRAKNMTLSDTSWSWQHRFEHIYLDADDKVDEKQRYNYFPSIGWQPSSKIGFYYTDTETKEIYGINETHPSYQTTIGYNESKQQISYKWELWNDALNRLKVQTWSPRTYRNDGSLKSIAYYIGKLNVPNDSIFFLREEVYGYKTPDISANDDFILQDQIRVFPNPSSTDIYIETKDQQIQVATIYDQMGKVRQTIKPTSDQFVMERKNLEAGMYYLVLSTTNGHSITKPIVFVE